MATPGNGDNLQTPNISVSDLWASTPATGCWHGACNRACSAPGGQGGRSQLRRVRQDDAWRAGSVPLAQRQVALDAELGDLRARNQAPVFGIDSSV